MRCPNVSGLMMVCLDSIKKENPCQICCKYRDDYWAMVKRATKPVVIPLNIK